MSNFDKQYNKRVDWQLPLAVGARDSRNRRERNQTMVDKVRFSPHVNIQKQEKMKAQVNPEYA